MNSRKPYWFRVWVSGLGFRVLNHIVSPGLDKAVAASAGGDSKEARGGGGEIMGEQGEVLQDIG